MVCDVERWVPGELGWHRVDGGTNRHRHDMRVEAGAELAGALEVSEQWLERGHPRVLDREVVEPAAVGGAGVERDLDDCDHVVAVLTHEGEVGLDVGPQLAPPVGSASIRGLM